jgi:hypothetical protein
MSSDTQRASRVRERIEGIEADGAAIGGSPRFDGVRMSRDDFAGSAPSVPGQCLGGPEYQSAQLLLRGGSLTDSQPDRPSALFFTILASLLGFELAHRVLELHPLLSSTPLTLVYLPLLVRAVALTTSAVIADPDNFGHVVVWTMGFAVLTIVLYAVLYSELGIVATAEPQPPNRPMTLTSRPFRRTWIGMSSSAP